MSRLHCKKHYRELDLGGSWRDSSIYADGLSMCYVALSSIPAGQTEGIRTQVATRPLTAGGSGQGWWIKRDPGCKQVMRFLGHEK